jgi:fatty acid desaturase
VSEQSPRTTTRAGAATGALAVPRAQSAWEAPTLALAALIYGGWLLLTWSWHALPLALSLPLGAWLLAWHGSLQHEIIHDHPTPHRWLNTAIAWVPIALWLPYGVYREAHRKHHREPWITDPVEDPESAYLTAGTWNRLGPAGRALRRFNLTLLGRLTCGPFLTLATVHASEARRIAGGDRRRLATWLVHLAGAAAVAAWVSIVCGVPLWLYAFGCVVPSIALTRLRAYAEHRYADAPEHRTAVVEGSPVLGLLFLFNNLHAVHHRWPTVPWYALPRLYRRERERVLKRNGGLLYRGYLDVVRRYLLTPHDDPVHPRHAGGG